jgi:hypothetical protein
MDSTNDGSLDQTSLDILFRCVKRGLPLTGICAVLQLEVPSVLRALCEGPAYQQRLLRLL